MDAARVLGPWPDDGVYVSYEGRVEPYEID